MDTTPTATETVKQYLVEAAKNHTEATRNNPYHRTAGGMSKMWWERTLGSKMSEPTSVVLLGMRQSGCQERRVLQRAGNGQRSQPQSGGRTVPPLQTNWQGNRRRLAVVRSGDVWWEQLQSHSRHRVNGKLL